MRVGIQAGTLFLDLKEGGDRVDELMTFASRQNPKRGFLFVSKVLGKHIPVKPSTMRSIYRELASQVPNYGGCFVVGLAETATGLGAGLADELAKELPALDVFYQHTTRHHLEHKLWFEIQESHSHAVGHLMYEPSEMVLSKLKQMQHLILVDDEMTTGKTLQQLADALVHKCDGFKKITIVTLANWISKEDEECFFRLNRDVNFIQLVKGHYRFDKDVDFTPELPAQVDNELDLSPSRDDLGRIAIKMPVSVSSEMLQANRTEAGRRLVVGTGEHLYQPFLIAEQLEKQGIDVLFQSTTRSPILMGDGIRRKMVLPKEDKLNYIYNLPKDRVLDVCVEADAPCALMTGQWSEAL